MKSSTRERRPLKLSSRSFFSFFFHSIRWTGFQKVFSLITPKTNMFGFNNWLFLGLYFFWDVIFLSLDHSALVTDSQRRVIRVKKPRTKIMSASLNIATAFSSGHGRHLSRLTKLSFFRWPKERLLNDPQDRHSPTEDARSLLVMFYLKLLNPMNTPHDEQ